MEMTLTLDDRTTALPYITPERQFIDFTESSSEELWLTFSPAVWENELFLVIDLYSASNPVHPAGHVGWWKCPLDEKKSKLKLTLSKSPTGFRVSFDGQEVNEFWVNPKFTGLDTDVLAMHIVLRQSLSEAIDFDDKLLLFNSATALEAAAARRQAVEQPCREPASVPWFVWPRDCKVHLISTNLFHQDAVGNYTFSVHRLLRSNGIPCQMYAGNFDPVLRPVVRHISDLFAAVDENDLLFVNFSIYDPFMPQIAQLACKKILYFHNITPPRFFQIYDAEHAAHCMKGVEQLKLLGSFQGVIANSESSAQVLKNLFNRAKTLVAGSGEPASTRHEPAGESFEEASRLLERAARILEQKSTSEMEVKVCPPFMNATRWLEIEAEPADLPPQRTLLLYVGRVAPHKRVEDLLALYRAFHKLDPDSALVIAGGASFDGYSGYLRYLMNSEFKDLKEHIHFRDSVSDGHLKSLYPAASAFVTMSEHEGFCVPLVEAMVFDTPVFAFGTDAVIETLGRAGRVFYDKHFDAIAADIHDVLHHDYKRAKIVHEQRRRLSQITASVDGGAIWSTVEEVFFRRTD